MHQVGILGAVRERAKRNRGRVAVFDRLSPRHAAHVVVDLQNGFMDHGQVAEVPMARMIVPNVNRISAALRAAGGTAVYTQHTADAVVRALSKHSRRVTPGTRSGRRWT
jgi:ureidoacrylate peracid hydrolase